MADRIIDKPIITKRESTILVEFMNPPMSDGHEALACEVVAMEQSKTDLSKYAVVISSNNKQIEMSAETFLYQLTNKRKSKLNADTKYKRRNLWEIEFYTDTDPSPLKIDSCEEIRQSIWAILKRNFQFFNEVFEIYEYLYAIPMFNLYRESYGDTWEACNKFYDILDNKLGTNSLEEFIEVCEGLRSCEKPRKIYNEKIEVHIQDEKKESSYNDDRLCQRFADCVKYAVPHHFSRYVLVKYFTDDQIFACYGGKQQAIKYLESALHTDIADLDNAVVLLKKLTFDKENKQFDSKIYMEQLISTILEKSEMIFGSDKFKKMEHESYSDMIYHTVSELMRLEKDKIAQ